VEPSHGLVEQLPCLLASSNIATAPDVKTAATAWGVALTALQTNNTSKTTARNLLDTALTNEPPLLREAAANKLAVVSAINLFSKGSKDTVQSFGVDVVERQARPQPIVPVNLRPMKVNKTTVASVRWDPTLGAQGYALQHTTNTADTTTYAAPFKTTGARYHLTGQTTGTTVYFRVAALDTALSGGQTAYTAWVAVLVT
jgi:hypothetical protein